MNKTRLQRYARNANEMIRPSTLRQAQDRQAQDGFLLRVNPSTAHFVCAQDRRAQGERVISPPPEPSPCEGEGNNEQDEIAALHSLSFVT